MKRLLVFLLFPVSAFGLTPEAREWIEISAQLEPVQCEKRQLRRQMAMAQAEQRGEDLMKLRAREAAINRNKETARLEKRLAELQSRILDAKGGARDPQDLDAISFQQRQAFYRCE